MNRLHKSKNNKFFTRAVSGVIIFSFVFTMITPPPYAYAQPALNLPAPGTMVTTSPAFVPPMLKGVIIRPEQPFQFDFVLDSGDTKLTNEEIKTESTKLIKYFLASLTMPEDELWVNLSPYEKDRIIPDEFGKTEMGRDLLAQDYLLKQLTASLLYPEEGLGKKFWDKVYTKANQLYGTTEVPVNTFNKVWIVPNKALLYENGDRAFIVESHLKVMLEEDYLAREASAVKRETNSSRSTLHASRDMSSQLIRDIILPEIENEVNNGKNFAKLRQIYQSFILASWYKKNLRESVLNQAYADQKKVAGLETDDTDIKKKIYNQYIAAYKKGVYDFIKEEYDETSDQVIPRKYFSGGVKVHDIAEAQRVIKPQFDSNDSLLTVGFGNSMDPAAGIIAFESSGPSGAGDAGRAPGDELPIDQVIDGKLDERIGDRWPEVLQFLGIDSKERIKRHTFYQEPDSTAVQRHTFELEGDVEKVVFYTKEWEKIGTFEPQVMPKAHELDIAPDSLYLPSQSLWRQFLLSKPARGVALHKMEIDNLETVEQVIRAVAYSLGKWHAAGYLHNDIVFGISSFKPLHIFLREEDGRLRADFIDFGLGEEADDIRRTEIESSKVKEEIISYLRRKTMQQQIVSGFGAQLKKAFDEEYEKGKADQSIKRKRGDAGSAPTSGDFRFTNDMPTDKELTLPDWAANFVQAHENKVYSTSEERMAIAIELSRLNVEHETGGPFGAAVFDLETGQLVSVGVNRVIPQRASLAHAEMMAMLMAQKRVENFTLDQDGPGLELVTSAQPCAMCFGAIPWSGVKSVITGSRGTDVEKITGFDEGPLHPDWVNELKRRGIKVKRDVMRKQANDVLRLYVKKSGVIYNARDDDAPLGPGDAGRAPRGGGFSERELSIETPDNQFDLQASLLATLLRKYKGVRVEIIDRGYEVRDPIDGEIEYARLGHRFLIGLNVADVSKYLESYQAQKERLQSDPKEKERITVVAYPDPEVRETIMDEVESILQGKAVSEFLAEMYAMGFRTMNQEVSVRSNERLVDTQATELRRLLETNSQLSLTVTPKKGKVISIREQTSEEIQAFITKHINKKVLIKIEGGSPANRVDWLGQAVDILDGSTGLSLDSREVQLIKVVKDDERLKMHRIDLGKAVLQVPESFKTFPEIIVRDDVLNLLGHQGVEELFFRIAKKENEGTLDSYFELESSYDEDLRKKFPNMFLESAKYDKRDTKFDVFINAGAKDKISNLNFIAELGQRGYTTYRLLYSVPKNIVEDIMNSVGHSPEDSDKGGTGDAGRAPNEGGSTKVADVKRVERRRISIDGATGWVGSHLTRWLAKRGGYDIDVLARKNSPRISSIPIDESIQITVDDILNINLMEERVKRNDAYFDFVAWSKIPGQEEPSDAVKMKINVLAPIFRMILTSRHEKRFIFPSSSTVYRLHAGSKEGNLKEDDLELDETLEEFVQTAADEFVKYAQAVLDGKQKQADDEMVDAFLKKHPLPVQGGNVYSLGKLIVERASIQFENTLVLRFPEAYGPLERTQKAIPKMFAAIVQGDESVEIRNDIKQYMDIHDVMRVLEASLDVEVEKDKRIINVPGPELITTASDDPGETTVASLIKEITGSPITFKVVNGLENPLMDNSRLREQFGFVPKISMREGLQSTYEWWRDQNEGVEDQERPGDARPPEGRGEVSPSDTPDGGRDKGDSGTAPTGGEDVKFKDLIENEEFITALRDHHLSPLTEREKSALKHWYGLWGEKERKSYKRIAAIMGMKSKSQAEDLVFDAERKGARFYQSELWKEDNKEERSLLGIKFYENERSDKTMRDKLLRRGVLVLSQLEAALTNVEEGPLENLKLGDKTISRMREAIAKFKEKGAGPGDARQSPIGEVSPRKKRGGRDNGDSGRAPQSAPGGIDFNPDMLDLETQGTGTRIPIPAVNAQQMNINIEGLFPVIINIMPVTNLPLLLGESQEEPQDFDLSLSR